MWLTDNWPPGLFYWLLLRRHVCADGDCGGILDDIRSSTGNKLLRCRMCEKLWVRRGKALEPYAGARGPRARGR